MNKLREIWIISSFRINLMNCLILEMNASVSIKQQMGRRDHLRLVKI